MVFGIVRLAASRLINPVNTMATVRNGTTAFRFFSTETISKEQLEKMVKKNKVVVFMKGVPDAPKCGFSNAVVQILRMHAVSYDSHDVLENESIRQGIKDFTNWPTIPQVFIDGEFVGGCDILLQMHQSGELIEELKKVGITSDLLKKDNSSDETK
ncbi:glutaredoxin-related protein 5, mitochondrial [Contarinia nasturtii]|uniref:glutaredoxin-related protein 5, mitochondrial n=1 Tax=Contarinia nasturtii TaxID=265458 RepID=UPI0012D4B4F2|nr:glutaredoxin-related protein 5, mitochondrial [Contarinia nasturtii]XP_031623939.1 glutaredoxin-related protein 5, mitochondrial [Contarinia nasturtii]